MKRYRFRLERIQKLRERTREMRRLAHSEAVQYRQRVGQQIDLLERIMEAEKAALRQALGEKEISVDSAIRSRTFETVLHEYGQRLDTQLEQIKKVVQTRRDQLVQSEREVRILEKLDEKAQARYETVLGRAEQQLLDELGNVAVSRKGELLETLS